MTDDVQQPTAEDAIQAAFCARHGCLGMAGAALVARNILASLARQDSSGLPWAQAARLRAWADVLLDAAKRLEASK